MVSIYDRIVQWVIIRGDAELQLCEDDISDAEITWRRMGLSGIYSSKPGSITSRLTSNSADVGKTIIGAYGIPMQKRRQWLQDAAMSSTVWFLGDLDGTDIMSYCALSDGAVSGGIRYFGICDSLLAKFNIPMASLEPYLIPATSAETAAIEALREMGLSIEAIVGPDCSSILQGGNKIEIEGLLWEIEADELVACVVS